MALGLLAVQQWQAQYGDLEERAAALSKKSQLTIEVLVAQLDDFDSVCAGFNSAGKESWLPLFQGWTHRIVAALAELGIYELEVAGKTFDPQIAVGVGVALRPQGMEAAIPYEVAEVVKRGFANGEGKLLRKTEEITYQEGMGENE